MGELILPWPSAHLSPNARSHWRMRHRAAKRGKQEGFIVARAAGLVPGAMPAGEIHLQIEFYPPTRRLPDDDNMLARFKAYRDGIALALGVDDRAFVSHPRVMDEPRSGGQVVVRITGAPGVG